MTELWNILNSNLLIGLIFLVVIVPMYYSLGIPPFGKKKEEKEDSRIDELEKHALVANHEMGEVKDTLKDIKDNIKETHSYLREHADSDQKFQLDILRAINEIKK